MKNDRRMKIISFDWKGANKTIIKNHHFVSEQIFIITRTFGEIHGDVHDDFAFQA